MNRVYELTQRIQELKAAAASQAFNQAWDQALETLQRLRDAAIELGDVDHQMLALLEIGRVLRTVRQYSDAHEAFALGLAVAGRAENVEITIRMLFEDSRVSWDEGEQDTCIEKLQHASELSQRLVGRGPETFVRTELASRLLEAGRPQDALPEADWSLRLAMSTRQSGLALQAGFIRLQTLQQLGRLQDALDGAAILREPIAELRGDAPVQLALRLTELRRDLGDTTGAREELEAARLAVESPRQDVSSDLVVHVLALLRELGDGAAAEALEALLQGRLASREELIARARARWDAAQAQLAAGQLDAAGAELEAALELARPGELDGPRADLLRALALVAEGQRDLPRAVQLLTQAAATAAQAQDSARVAESMFELGRLRYIVGDVHAAMSTLREVEQLQATLKERRGLARTRLLLASLLARFGLFPEASAILSLIERALPELSDVEHLDLQVAFERACLQRLAAQAEEAVSTFAALAERAAAAGRVDLEATCQAQRGELLRELRRPEEALAALDRARELARQLGDRRLEATIDHWTGLTLLDAEREGALDALQRAWDGILEAGADDAELQRFREALDLAEAKLNPST